MTVTCWESGTMASSLFEKMEVVTEEDVKIGELGHHH